MIKGADVTSDTTSPGKSTNLRFFGDTDQESINETIMYIPKNTYNVNPHEEIGDSEEDIRVAASKSDSKMNNSTSKGSPIDKIITKYDLDRPDYGLKQMNHGLNLNSKYEYQSPKLNDTTTSKNEPWGEFH